MHRSTFLPLQHAATLIFSVDWGLYWPVDDAPDINASDHLRFCVARTFKGLESKAVILILGPDATSADRTHAYVGMTRSRVHLTVLAHADLDFTTLVAGEISEPVPPEPTLEEPGLSEVVGEISEPVPPEPTLEKPGLSEVVGEISEPVPPEPTLEEPGLSEVVGEISEPILPESTPERSSPPEAEPVPPETRPGGFLSRLRRWLR